MPNDEVTPMSPAPQEPSDYHVYNWVSFREDTFEFFLAAVRFYESQLRADLEAVQQDPDLRQFLSAEVLETYPIAKELGRVQRVLAWFAAKMEGARKPSGYDVDIAHELVRFLKSVSLLYLEHLRRRRQAIASRPTTSKALLQAIDQQLARMEEKAHMGVFSVASPYPLALDQLPVQPEQSAEPTSSRPPEAQVAIKPRPVVLDTIEIQDATLRRRCLDLFAQFSQDGQHDRLDAVVSEATRYLEDRLRSLVGAAPTVIGVELARYAFGPPDFRLVVSDIPAEQEGVHHLCRGVFAFIRNSVGHRSLGHCSPSAFFKSSG